MSEEAELALFAELQEQMKGSDGRGRGLANYDELVGQIKAKWADGSRQKKRAEWEIARGPKKPVVAPHKWKPEPLKPANG